MHDNVIKWKHFPRNWPFARGIHRSPVNSLHKGQWRGVLMFSLIYVWINGWVNNREAGDLRRYRAHYDVTVIDHVLGLVCMPQTHHRNLSCEQAALWIVQSVRPPVCPSVRLTFFHYVLIIISLWNFPKLIPLTEVMSMQKGKVKGQRPRSQRSKPNLAVSEL